MNEELQGLPDLVAPDLKVLFCGVNPGLSSARTQQHFHNRSNRFWKVLYLAGFTSRQLKPSESTEILKYGCGLTTAVSRPTLGVQDLKAHEFTEAASSLKEKVTRYSPKHLAFIGKTAYAGITKERVIPWGQQPYKLGDAQIWVLPNTSGLNRAFRLSDLVEAYSELYRAASTMT